MPDLFETLRTSIDDACEPVSVEEAIARGVAGAVAIQHRRGAGRRHVLALATVVAVGLLGVGAMWREWRGLEKVHAGAGASSTTVAPAVLPGRCAADPPQEFLPSTSLLPEQQIFAAPGTGVCGHMVSVGGGATDEVGWASVDDLTASLELIPVYDDAARQIAWWAAEAGWLDLETVADPSFDLGAARARARSAVSGGGGDASPASLAQGPEAPPDGWRPVDHEGMRLYVPPTWTVVTSGCHGGDRTVTLGLPPASAKCASPSGDWIWIPPAETVADQSVGCATGSINWVPGCVVQDLQSGRQIQFAHGVSVALVSQRNRLDSQASAISDTWRYVDQERPEAQPGFGGESPLGIAIEFGGAISAGRCSDASALAAPGVEVMCEAADPPRVPGVYDAGLVGFGGAVPTQSARLTIDPGRVTLDLVLQVRWEPAQGRASWRVISVASAPPG